MIAAHRLELGLPVTDPLTRPGSELVEMVLRAFPALARPRVPLTA